jgi:hypothetical protein
MEVETVAMDDVDGIALQCLLNGTPVPRPRCSHALGVKRPRRSRNGHESPFGDRPFTGHDDGAMAGAH